MKLFLGLALLVFAIVSCGKEESAEPSPTPTPAPIVKPVPVPKGEFAEKVLPLLDKYCARCHTEAFVSDETEFLTSNARKRAGNKTMPLIGSPEAKTLSQADRDTIANFK